MENLIPIKLEQQQQVTNRLQRIFEVFLSENFSTTSNVYFEKLITHLGDTENSYILENPFVLDFVDKCVTLLSENFNRINPKVTSLMLNVCSFLVQNEWKLVTIKERNIMDRILAIIAINKNHFSPSVKLGCIRLLAAVSRYSLGLAYIRSKKCWLYLIELCNRDHTMYVVREARELLYQLIYKFSVKAKDENIVLEILTEIIQPINDSVFKEGSENIMINVDDTKFQHKMSSTLNLLSYLFEQTLVSEEKANIANLCQIHHNLEISIWKLTEMSQNYTFVNKIFKAITSLNFAILVQDQWDEGQIAPEKFTRFGLNFYNTMKFCVQRRQLLNFIKLAELNHILWKKLGKRAPSEIQVENERVKFENQLITFQLMPVLFIMRSKEFVEEDIFDNYIMKLFEISCEHTLRICYAFRDTILTAESAALQAIADLAYKAIHGVLAMQNILEREQAILVFQAMMYALKEFITHSNTSDKEVKTKCGHWAGMEFIVAIPNVLYATLIGMHTLIKRYRITWTESIETTCVVNTVAIILENPNLTEGLAVQALKLVQLSIEHFLSPNMALLVDNLQGSGLVCLGPIIIKRFHDSAWEVRDSTLELVTSIAHISRIKFPAFQYFLNEYEMCPIVLQMAKHDEDPYVRASAFKCLSKMVMINAIWEADLSKSDLIELLFIVLYNESEGIVRQEAMKTLAAIYDHRKIPIRFTDTLYSTLTHCVVIDLHWEVKVEALRFWELEIQNQFTNQGMIDGTFPTVTFSKENKKIVTLTEKEIHLRIMKVFKELSQRGCLGVILTCLREECDLEVLKTAVCMVHCLLEQLNKYDFERLVETSITQNSDNSTPVTPGTNPTPPTEDKLIDTNVFVFTAENNITNSDNNSTASTEQPDEPTASNSSLSAEEQAQSNEVIDYILGSKDINLLAASCEMQLHLNNGNGDVSYTLPLPCVDSDLYKRYTSVGVLEFMQTIKILDLNQLLRNHNEWFQCSESFASLLDDIMCSIRCKNDAQFADCY